MPIKPLPKIVSHITVNEFFETGKDSLQLSLHAGEKGLDNLIRDKSLNRPALALTGYYKNFATKRIQLCGAGEIAFLRDTKINKQYKILTEIVRKEIPCIVVSRDLVPTKPLVEVCDEYNIPLIRSKLNTRDFLNTSTIQLEEQFAPRVVEHGTLMDVKGIGVLIKGESGLGKSECALALIERGHSLVADDIVYIKLMGEKELLGRSSDLNRGYMECRGLGIVNIAELFGIRAIRMDKGINLVVTFKEFKLGMEEDRTGLEQDYVEMLGKNVPQMTFPIRPGRDLARLVEVAAMVQALKQMGHNSAKEFNDRLIQHMALD